ncbi:hypothetical protein [uncultured Dokdonia sp.]|uniref:DUF6913 domain-containing protein n=1 Tax=uncultured Dokdonia sp. TaxID=575653 RepID=UPI0026051164|nr:hypothetical protein [uncultured Dokdonia sp.]
MNGLKAKSILRKLKKETESRTYTPSGRQIRSLGIVQEGDRPFDANKIKQLAATLGIKENDIVVLSYMPKLSKAQKDAPGVYSGKGIGWNGTLKTTTLKEFVAKDFDILLSYYSEDRLPLQIVSGLSKATFKVGLIEDAQSFQDLVITTAIDEETLFINELEKYLQILKIS